MSNVDARRFTPEDAAEFTAPNREGSRIPNTMRLPDGYQAPGREQIIEQTTQAGLSFKGEAVPWGIATGPTVLPEALGEDLGRLGDSLHAGYTLVGKMLRRNDQEGKQNQERVRDAITAHIPAEIPVENPSKNTISIMRPDVVLRFDHVDDGTVEVSGKLAEVETRPAGTFMTAALLDGYGIGKEEYMEAWADSFRGRPWAAVVPREWELYAPELEAFGRSVEDHGGKFAGVHMVDEVSQTVMDEAFPDRVQMYIFGYTDVWQNEDALDTVKAIQKRPGVIAYNPLDIHLETKATLSVMSQPWFLEAMKESGDAGKDHADRLERWLPESYVLSLNADQDVNWGAMLKKRKEWLLKRAGFDRDATESRGLIIPGDPGFNNKFETALYDGIGGKNGSWIAQKFVESRMPQEFFHPQEHTVVSFDGAVRLTPIYWKTGKQVDMLGGMSTVTYGSAKAHGGSGAEIKPGMSVMAPVVFGEATHNGSQLVFDGRK